jgi:Zn-dependent alcohol dehydrogenases
LTKQIQAIAKDGVDVVFDCFGKDAFKIGLNALKKEGRIVSILERLDPIEAQRREISASYVFVQPNGTQLKQIADLIDQKKVVSQPIEEMPLKEAAAAQEKLRQGDVMGKLVLKVH